jgi:hypothetical protein
VSDSNYLYKSEAISLGTKLTLEIEAEAPEGFPESEVSVVRHNDRQLKFRAESTGFEE